MRVTALAALLLVFAPGLTDAQGPQGAQFDQAIRASVALQLAARPSLEPAAPHAALLDDFLAQRRRRRDKQTGVTLMIIGGSAVVVGAIVGDTGGAILIVGGLVCAGYGFYLYSE